MSAGLEPRFQGSPKLPPWDLTSSHAELYDMQENTRIILETYEVCLSQLLVNENINVKQRSMYFVQNGQFTAMKCRTKKKTGYQLKFHCLFPYYRVPNKRPFLINDHIDK